MVKRLENAGCVCFVNTTVCFYRMFCDFYDSPLFYSYRTQERKESHNLHCQGSVNVKGHIKKFALVQGPLSACPIYRLLTEILRVNSYRSPSIRSHIPCHIPPYIDWQSCNEFRFYPFSARWGRESNPRL